MNKKNKKYTNLRPETLVKCAAAKKLIESGMITYKAISKAGVGSNTWQAYVMTKLNGLAPKVPTKIKGVKVEDLQGVEILLPISKKMPSLTKRILESNLNAEDKMALMAYKQE